jgi:superfamily II DNA or RNA helicase
MARLEDLTRGAVVRGILPDGAVSVVDVKWFGSACVELTYKDTSGRLGHELIYRDREPTIEIVQAGAPWSFDGDGGLLRLVSEAYRIRLAYLFDPILAVHTSNVEPLPHQITAVYGEMLARQPLRFLLADDPGAGKTIMTGLFMKELMARGDLHRCLICCPGNLVEQWQDELNQRFHLPFDPITRERIETSRTGNPFAELNHVIARLDHMARNEDIQEKLEQTDWDLIVCDEAHKLSASYYGNEIKYTKRYHLGQRLARLTRHFLLLTATPHNGKEEDFHLFLALLDPDRFEGRYREGIHTADASDLMRRLVKEQLVKFDGTPLFPERRAYTVNFGLSDDEAHLYEQVTSYVREEFNRADALDSEGRKGTVGFALTTLQRRLASSPEAIYQSLRRRRERLEARVREERLMKRGAQATVDTLAGLPQVSDDDMEDLDDAPSSEAEQLEQQVVDQASAARTIAELEAELVTLRRLEALALQVHSSGQDTKWRELSNLLQDNTEMFDAHGYRRKLVIFTEHRDTLNYLTDRIRALFGLPDAVVTIHGGLPRDVRRRAQESFTHDKDVSVLVATDAAGEGINLQRAHLMVNYDLPWNPNRLEQRFGRIHRIGQTEVCHLWNLVAEETREGDVFHRLLEKLEVEREALGGGVFDVLGKVLQGKELRLLLIEAIRYGERPEVRSRLTQVIDERLDRQHLRDLLEERSLTRDTLDTTRVRQIREDMERAEARRLQPYFISAFFMEAFKLLGGTIREREPKRYEITHVPAAIRNRDRIIGTGQAVLARYERATFEKHLVNVPGKPFAAFLCPGHPLLEATTDLILEQYRDLLKRGAVLVDPTATDDRVRVLFYLEHSIQDARLDRSGQRRIVSRQMQFVEIDESGRTRTAGYAPYLDYRPLTDEERPLLGSLLEANWLKRNLEDVALQHAITELVPRHFEEVAGRKRELLRRTQVAVKDRLSKEINFWDLRAQQLKAEEQAGKQPKLNWRRAQQRADDLQSRLRRRMEELDQEGKLAPAPPIVAGGALVIPEALLSALKGERPVESDRFARETAHVERLAMEAVMEAERGLGFEPRDVSADNRGYDIESRIPGAGRLRFIEVKGRRVGARTVTITKNEILTGLNKPDDFILAIVEVDGEAAAEPRYVRRPFQREPDFGVTSVNYDLSELIDRAERSS